MRLLALLGAGVLATGTMIAAVPASAQHYGYGHRAGYGDHRGYGHRYGYGHHDGYRGYERHGYYARPYRAHGWQGGYRCRVHHGYGGPRRCFR